MLIWSSVITTERIYWVSKDSIWYAITHDTNIRPFNPSHTCAFDLHCIHKQIAISFVSLSKCLLESVCPYLLSWVNPCWDHGNRWPQFSQTRPSIHPFIHPSTQSIFTSLSKWSFVFFVHPSISACIYSSVSESIHQCLHLFTSLGII